MMQWVKDQIVNDSTTRVRAPGPNRDGADDGELDASAWPMAAAGAAPRPVAERGATVRNLVLLPIMLANGFRRLWPW
jgi:hypothetical protein